MWYKYNKLAPRQKKIIKHDVMGSNCTCLRDSIACWANLDAGAAAAHEEGRRSFAESPYPSSSFTCQATSVFWQAATSLAGWPVSGLREIVRRYAEDPGLPYLTPVELKGAGN